MFKATILSSIVIAIAIATNHGYNVLRHELDEYVANTYGQLEHFDNPELKQAGSEALGKYEDYTLEQ